MYLKPTDLGPHYKEPVLAEVYLSAVDSPDELLSWNNTPSPKWLDGFDHDALGSRVLNIYIHDRL